MSTELMKESNPTGTISMTGIHRGNKRRYQITVQCYDLRQEWRGLDGVAYVEVDAETIANMQRCVDEYRELCEVYPDSED